MYDYPHYRIGMRLGEYISPDVVNPISCDVKQTNSCAILNNSRCQDIDGATACTCLPGYYNHDPRSPCLGKFVCLDLFV